MEGSRILRFLRIAVTALSLTACALLIALWVRSYWWTDFVQKVGVTTIGSSYGSLYVSQMNMVPRHPVQHWESDSIRSAKQKQQLSWQSEKAFTFIRAPYWAIVPPLFLLAVFTAPWIPWSRRFSLRTLLIATTLVAVALGVVVISR